MSLHKRLLLLSFNSFPRNSKGVIDSAGKPCFSVYRLVDRITESSPLIRNINLIITGLGSCCGYGAIDSNGKSIVMYNGVVDRV